MAKKDRPTYMCSDCGHDEPKWFGVCRGCNLSGTAEEVSAQDVAARAGLAVAGSGAAARPRVQWVGPNAGKPVPLGDVPDADVPRISTGLEDFDHVLGGGGVPGTVVLLGGEPGVGKSTILTQVSALMAERGLTALYASGEESAAQVAARGRRIGGGAAQVLFLGGVTSIDAILAHAQEIQPTILVVDSMQTMYDPELPSAAGSIPQVKQCAARLSAFAKQFGVLVFLVGHVTKDGDIAGPKTLEHIVDTVIYFAMLGADEEYRAVRASKNRYGNIDELGVFRMTEKGLVGVANPSAIFLEDREVGASGSAIVAVMEGTRPLLVEVQGLSSLSAFGAPQRLASGYSRQRLVLMAAVLEKRAGIPFAQMDAFVNVVGGLDVSDPAADLAICAALISSSCNTALPQDAVFIGEVGLGGEVRRAGKMERRLAEAAKLGFKRVFTAQRGVPAKLPDGLEVVPVSHVADLMFRAIGRAPGASLAPVEAAERVAGAPAARVSGKRGDRSERRPRSGRSEVPIL